MKKYDIIYQEGKTYIQLYKKGKVFTGTAHCHPNDEDFASERTGGRIAEARATILLLRCQRDYELKPQLKILKHLYHNVQNSKYHNPKSHEFYRIKSQLKSIEKQIDEINNEINEIKCNLKTYIDLKDNFYKRLRAKKDKDNQ